MKKLLLAAAVAAILSAPAASAAPTIVVRATLAPNIFGSPSWATWRDNALTALKTGVNSYGTPGTPTYFETRHHVSASEAIVTGFPSWLGKADPGTVFGPAFANELGNRMSFVLSIDGNGSQFSISQLGFVGDSNDAGNLLDFSGSPGFFNYSADYVGVLKGADGQLFTGDDVYITSGANTQLVDGLVGRGRGNSIAAQCPGCTVAQQQAAIDAAAALTPSSFDFNGTYSLNGATGSASFLVSPGAVPEPATWATMLIGFAAAGFGLRRRKAMKAATA